MDRGPVPTARSADESKRKGMWWPVRETRRPETSEPTTRLSTNGGLSRPEARAGTARMDWNQVGSREVVRREEKKGGEAVRRFVGMGTLAARVGTCY